MLGFSRGSALLLITAYALSASAQKISSFEAPPTELEAAVEQPRGTTTPLELQEQSRDKKKHKGSGAIVVVPLPISSPAIGSGIVPVVAYIFRSSSKGKAVPPSVVGGVGLFTNNGSRAFAVGGQLYLRDGTYRLTSGFARGNLNYNIYGTGSAAGLKLPLKQTGRVFQGEFLRQIGWGFFAGPRFMTGRSLISIRPNQVSNFPNPPDTGIHTTLTAIGADLTRDTSRNRFYPTRGTYFDFKADVFSQALGSKYSFESYRVTFDKYGSLRKNQVLAYNAYFCATGGEAPFYGKCIYGANNELRGYVAGQYFTRYMIATQLEYRLVLPMRFGMVVFGGVGEAITGEVDSYGLQKFLPSGGGGLRYELSKKYHVNLRADIAQGRDGYTFGLGVGEAF